MYTDIEKAIKECIECLFHRTNKKCNPPLNPVVTIFPLELLCIDLIDMGKNGTTGFRYILTMIDHFSKFAHALPICDKSADSTAKALVENFFLTFGPPKRIHSDKGKNFAIIFL